MSIPRTAANPARASSQPNHPCAYGLNRDAISESGAGIIGQTMWDRYAKWPVYSKFSPKVNPNASTLAADKT